MTLASVRTQIEAVPRNHDTGPWSFVLHLGPVIGPGKYAVTVSRIEITLDSGASRTVTGPWTSALSVPTNVTSSLATQTLKSAQPANADGIAVTGAKPFGAEIIRWARTQVCRLCELKRPALRRAFCISRVSASAAYFHSRISTNLPAIAAAAAIAGDTRCVRPL